MSDTRNARLFVACVVVAVLCACSQGSPTMPPLEAAGATVISKSSDKTVLLVTDAAAGDAQIISYRTGQVLETLTGLGEPEGACSDGAGHFWITSTTAASIIEFTTDGTKLGTLTDPSGLPVGCAYDPKTGDLAVSNILSKSYGAGSLEIYKGAKGTPRTYGDPSMFKMYFLAYAGLTGTLVVDGLNSSYQVALASFQSGKFKAISLTGMPVEFPGAMAWSTTLNIMNVADQDTNTIYRFDLNGKVKGTTTAGNGNDIIFGGTLLSYYNGSPSGIGVFRYPAGGAPKRVIPGSSQLVGLAISSALTQ